MTITKWINDTHAKQPVFNNAHAFYRKPDGQDEDTFVKIINGKKSARMLFADRGYVGIFSKTPPDSLEYIKILVIPRKKVENITELTKSELQDILTLCDGVANQLSYNSYYTVVTNCGKDANQSIAHLHFHAEAHYTSRLQCRIYDLIASQIVSKGLIDKGFNIIGKLYKAGDSSSCVSKKNTSVVEWLKSAF